MSGIRPVRWSARRAEVRGRLGGYRAPAPDPSAEPGELAYEPWGEYMALRDGWLMRLVKRLRRHL